MSIGRQTWKFYYAFWLCYSCKEFIITCVDNRIDIIFVEVPRELLPIGVKIITSIIIVRKTVIIEHRQKCPNGKELPCSPVSSNKHCGPTFHLVLAARWNNTNCWDILNSGWNIPGAKMSIIIYDRLCDFESIPWLARKHPPNRSGSYDANNMSHRPVCNWSVD
jgi:hypothetical protein